MMRFDRLFQVAHKLAFALMLCMVALGSVARAQPKTEEGAIGLPELRQLVAAKLPAHLSLTSVAIDKMGQKGSYTLALGESGAVRSLPVAASVGSPDASPQAARRLAQESSARFPGKGAQKTGYEGSWVGGPAPQGPRGSSIELSLWRTDTGQLAGVAYYGEACSG